MINIKTELLKQIFALMIQKLENEDVKTIQIADDLYNKIPTHKWDISNSNIEESIVIGSLVDDYETLIKLITDKERPCTYVDFDRMASLLRAISQNRNPI